MIQAVEFFSGIGAFAFAAERSKKIEMVASFDQSENANSTYRLNFGRNVNSRNLDGITADEIPDAQLWWLSPPCTPYSVRGNRKDSLDSRAQSFINLISLIDSHRPRYLAVENVAGFVNSQVHGKLLSTLDSCGYSIREIDLCSTQFGIPMRRPRHFVLASQAELSKPISPQRSDRTPLRQFVHQTTRWRGEDLTVSQAELARYGESYHIIDSEDEDAVASCFTSGYGKSQRSSGSFIRTSDQNIRRFSPKEIANLLGFPPRFDLSPAISLPASWRLTGNSVDVRCIELCLQQLLPPLSNAI